jgi:hypothetical protein
MGGFHVGCLLAVLALVTPRFVLVVMWLFSNYISRAIDGWIVPVLGFIFLPTTTIAYTFAENEFGGVRGGGLLLVILGVLLDVGLIGGGARGRSSA